ncbi:FkbM family methyltransferase [Fluviicola taffensis]|uniref:FkbM family methyltransferase n=1 Tax=Fluviicola taffensis TaxID=191579 RepID=UPI00313800CD
MKHPFTNQVSEKLLILIILFFNSRNWVYKVVPTNTHYKKGSIRNVTRKGISYQLDLSDYQEWLIYFYCKSDSSEYVLDYLNKSEVIFDIGANVGQTALSMFKTQKKKALNPSVYAFEPFPSTFQKLETNIRLNKQLEIKAYNLGLSKEKGSLHMMKPTLGNSGGFRMTNDQKKGIPVSVISIDEFVFEKDISQVDFIKIDVEGFELQVLKGAELTIKRFKPILVFEYSIKNIEAQQGNIDIAINQLISMNYEISTKEGLSNLDEILTLDYQTDLICIPN